MSWFRIDDRFHSHPKVLRAGNAAVGLWVRCGAYSTDYGTDGLVLAEIVARFGAAPGGSPRWSTPDCGCRLMTGC